MFAEAAAARFYAELLVQQETDRAARAAGVDGNAEAEELADLDERIPFLVQLPDSSLHVALLDEELSFRAPVGPYAASTAQPGSIVSATSVPSDDEASHAPTELPTAFIAPPSIGQSSSLSTPAFDGAASSSHLASTLIPTPALTPSRDPPPPPTFTPAPDTLQRQNTADRESVSQRLWRFGSNVFLAAEPDNDIPKMVIWSIVNVPASLLPAAFHPSRERSTTLRWRPNRSFQQLSGALGLHRAESGGSSRSMFRSHTNAPDTAADSAVYMPMHPENPEESLSDECSEEESAAIAADYPEGTWPESVSSRFGGRSGRFRCALPPSTRDSSAVGVSDCHLHWCTIRSAALVLSRP